MAMEPTPRASLLSEALPDVAIGDTVVPEFYRWPPDELRHVAHDDFVEDEIPVIDLQAGDLDETRKMTREACATWGFFQVVNHGVDRELLDRVQTVMKKFFDLPLETKEKLECTMEGDRQIGYGFLKPNKLKKSRRMWSEGLFVDIPHVDGFASKMWPDEALTRGAFCDTMEEYFQALRALGVRLFRLVLESLGVCDAEQEKFQPKEPALVRMNHYPPCPDPGSTTGLVPHHDSNLLTLLLQGDVGGLQVLKDGRWVAVRPRPGAFAVNAGNMLQVISNDACTSATHKAVVNKNEDRYSLAYFVQAPDWDEILPLPELVDENHPAKYRPFTWPQYLKKSVEHPADTLRYFAVAS